ncbi:MAG TPA: hypothetical protein VIR78_08535 [Malonomonas sp.]
MTSFRQLSCCCALLVVLLAVPVFASEQPAAEHETFLQLQHDNVELQSKVRRLEQQVAALRDELNAPDATQVIGGIGYIVGLFGIAGWFAARKKARQEK